jgi:hypothetical protein
MKTKHQVHNLIILDESGSMDSIKPTIINGFNEIVQTVKSIAKEFPKQEHLITFITFNSLAQKEHHFAVPVNELQEINADNYLPNSGTPLYDAMGFAINKLRTHLLGKTDNNVLVTILTDGEENASKEYKNTAIKNLVEELKQKNWTFTYIGTDHDVESFAINLSITNHKLFSKTFYGMKTMFVEEQISRRAYSEKIDNNEDTKDGFYGGNEGEKKN